MELKNCVYRFIDKKNKILYVGKARNLQNRIKKNYHINRHLPNECYDQNALVEYIKLDNENDMNFSEQYYIQKYKPAYNTFYQNKQITISVPDLDKKNWSIFYIDMSAAKKQLSDFYNNLYGEDFKFTTIKVDIDLFDYLKYYVLKYSGFFSERKTFHSFLKSGETLNSNHIKWFRNLIKKHAENSNLRKLDPIIYFEKKLTNELNKNLSIMFKEYPLLSYQIISRPEESGLEYPKEMITLNDFVSTLDFENNRFLMTLNVFCKTNDLAKIICTLYVECT